VQRGGRGGAFSRPIVFINAAFKEKEISFFVEEQDCFVALDAKEQASRASRNDIPAPFFID
jgi:hypothetical protein